MSTIKPQLVPLLSHCLSKAALSLVVTHFKQGKPPYAASAEEVAKELKSRSGESKSSAVSSDGSLAENGAVAEKLASQMNGSAGDARAPSHSESALNNDSKTCNTNPHLNALSTDSACCGADALEAAVLKQEE